MGILSRYRAKIELNIDVCELLIDSNCDKIDGGLKQKNKDKRRGSTPSFMNRLGGNNLEIAEAKEGGEMRETQEQEIRTARMSTMDR